jgi:hypothetical protein
VLFVGLLDRSCEVVARHRAGEIHQGPGNRRDRDAVNGGDVLGIEGAGAVDADPREIGRMRCRRDVRVDMVGGSQVMQPGRVAMTQNRTGPGGQHPREPMPFPSQLRVPGRVHPSVQADQLPAAYAVSNRRPWHTGSEELRAGDHAPLVGRQRPDYLICVVAGRHTDPE